jgi:hypothetical protein
MLLRAPGRPTAERASHFAHLVPHLAVIGRARVIRGNLDAR